MHLLILHGQEFHTTSLTMHAPGCMHCSCKWYIHIIWLCTYTHIIIYSMWRMCIKREEIGIFTQCTCGNPQQNTNNHIHKVTSVFPNQNSHFTTLDLALQRTVAPEFGWLGHSPPLECPRWSSPHSVRLWTVGTRASYWAALYEPDEMCVLRSVLANSFQ